MLSILIPVYNFDIRDFVAELHAQASKCAVDFEIICYDDASEDRFKEVNRTVKTLSDVYYTELPENIGRSKIRNELAKNSRYGQLLFLDCDSKILSPDFISKYIVNCKGNLVIYGGRNYEAIPPVEQEKYFRWYYGIKRETFHVEKRKRHPYKSFMTNNFMIPKAVFLAVKFNENLSGYGHEDTLFGDTLHKNNITIHHIDNPLYHIGLEATNDFILKTEQGLQNLRFILTENLLTDDVRIVFYYRLAKRFWLSSLIHKIFNGLEKTIRHNLNSKNPQLLLFDLYKLGYLISLEKSPRKIK